MPKVLMDLHLCKLESHSTHIAGNSYDLDLQQLKALGPEQFQFIPYCRVGELVDLSSLDGIIHESQSFRCSAVAAFGPELRMGPPHALITLGFNETCLVDTKFWSATRFDNSCVLE